MIADDAALRRGESTRAVGVQADVAREVVTRREGDRAGGGDPVLADPLRPLVAAARGDLNVPHSLGDAVAQWRRRALPLAGSQMSQSSLDQLRGCLRATR